MKKSSYIDCNNSGAITIFADSNNGLTETKYTVTKNAKKDLFTCAEGKLFEEIYNLHLRKVISFAYSYLNDIYEAQNIAHDVFIAFWHARENINLTENVLPYLLAATRNKCLNVIKKNNNALKYNKTTLQTKNNYLKTIGLDSNTAIKIYEMEVESLMYKAVEQMKPKVRKTFLLSRMSGLKNKEIAYSEGVAESTVEARITSALLVLRKLLKDYIR